jgi:uncharacterized protein YceH (UPF0502 family)
MSTDARIRGEESWPVLSVIERRVLGVLVEKAKTTPDVYPLSVNSLVTGANQKSNRDPLLNVSDAEVEDSLNELQKRNYVTRITGGRVERWRHNLYDLWGVNKVELAILAELLLRGPQTEGELRGRASRMEPIEDLDALRTVLGPLKERKLVVYLGPEGRRGVQLTHGFHAANELQRLQSLANSETPMPRSENSAAAPVHQRNDLEQARSEIAALRSQVEDLSRALQQLADEVQGLKQSLGA